MLGDSGESLGHINCVGVGEFDDGSTRPIEFDIAGVGDGEWASGFDYEGQDEMMIPKSEWDAGRRE